MEKETRLESSNAVTFPGAGERAGESVVALSPAPSIHSQPSVTLAPGSDSLFWPPMAPAHTCTFTQIKIK